MTQYEVSALIEYLPYKATVNICSAVHDRAVREAGNAVLQMAIGKLQAGESTISLGALMLFIHSNAAFQPIL